LVGSVTFYVAEDGGETPRDLIDYGFVAQLFRVGNANILMEL
jgi:hypothetical protein